MPKLNGKTPAQLISLTNVASDGLLAKPRGLSPAFYTKVREMRRDPTIKLARWFAIAPLLASSWSYEQNDRAAEGSRELIQETMDDIRLDLLRTALLGWIDYGWQPYERIYKHHPIDGSVRPTLKPLLQDYTDILVLESTGEIAGLRQDPVMGTDIKEVVLSVEESFVAFHDEEGTNWYGEPVMKALERIYDESLKVADNARKYDKRIAGSHWVIYYPLGTSPFEGAQTDNGVIAANILQRIEAMGGLALPRSIVDSVDTLNALAAAGTEAISWKVELLTDSGAGQAPFLDRFAYYDKLKVRAFGFPERAILEGQFGTKAEAEAHADLAITNSEMRHRVFCQLFNRGGGGQPGIVNQILQFNYGPQYADTVWIEPAPIADRALAFIKEIYKAWFANPAGFMEEMMVIDKQSMREKIGLPVMETPMFDPGDPWSQDMQFMDAAAPPVDDGVGQVQDPVQMAWDSKDEKLGCAYYPLPTKLARRVMQLANDIDDNDLTDKGRTDEPHVTALYGFERSVKPRQIQKIIDTHDSPAITLGKLKVFQNKEHDVLVAEVDGSSLREIHEALSKLPNTQTHDEYRPHVTLAYLKPGRGAYYVKRWGNKLTDEHAQLNDITISFAFDPNQARDEKGRWVDVVDSAPDLRAKRDQLFKRHHKSDKAYLVRAEMDGLSPAEARRSLAEEKKFYADEAQIGVGVAGKQFKNGRAWKDSLNHKEEDAVIAWTESSKRLRKLDDAGKTSPQLKALLDAVSAAPKYSGPAYRGLLVEDPEKIFKPGRRVGVKGISSFSAKHYIAKNFATWPEGKQVPVVLKAKVKDARDIRVFNPYESEILVRRENFKVKSVKWRGPKIDRYLEVELE